MNYLNPTKNKKNTEICMQMHTCCNMKLHAPFIQRKTRVLLLSKLLLLRSSQRYLSERGTVLKNTVNKNTHQTKKFIWLRLKFWSTPENCSECGENGWWVGWDWEKKVTLTSMKNRVWLTFYENQNSMLHLFLYHLKIMLVKCYKSLNV